MRPPNGRTPEKEWIVAQLGAREHYAIPSHLERQGRLHTLITDFWSRRGWCPARAPAFLKSMAQRHTAAVPARKVVAHNTSAVLRRVARSTGYWGDACRADLAEGAAFARRAVRWLAKEARVGEGTAFFGYNTGSLEIMDYMAARGSYTVLDQIDPSLVEDTIVQRERDAFPEWEPGRRCAPPEYHERMAAEWTCANLVVVNSEWTREALIALGVPEGKLFVLPLTFSLAPGCSVHGKEWRPRPLRVVWVGTVMLRKGIQYLIRAAELLADRRIEIVVAGDIHIAPRVVARFPRNVRLLGRITRHEVEDVYRWGDVYVLPTLSDGFALTQLEAMAYGLPVVTTLRCGRVVDDGVNGLLVAPGNSEELATAIARLDDDRTLVGMMSEMAVQTVHRFATTEFPNAFRQLLARVDSDTGIRPAGAGREYVG